MIISDESVCRVSGRNDGKRPDGLTLVPWQPDRSVTWDVTSYVSQSAIQAGSVAITAASDRKTAKYVNLSSSHVFYPVAVETVGALADDALVFLAEIGRSETLYTANPRKLYVLVYQRISVAIQRFNSVCLANSSTVSESQT